MEKAFNLLLVRLKIIIEKFWAVSSVVERPLYTGRVKGSNPLPPTKIIANYCQLYLESQVTRTQSCLGKNYCKDSRG